MLVLSSCQVAAIRQPDKHHGIYLNEPARPPAFLVSVLIARRPVAASTFPRSPRPSFPKYRRTHSNHRRTLCNCDLIVPAHAHRKLRQRKTRLAR
jgi:hypothetical protein